jgi:hypothetical protein
MERKTFELVDKILDTLYKADGHALRLPSEFSARPDVVVALRELDDLIGKFQDFQYELGMDLEMAGE